MSQRTGAWAVSDLIGGRVRGMQEYAPEPLAETARRLGVAPAALIKLDANENPYGPTEPRRQGAA
jgi:histidinol-phosphate/aromatic aminotransferase/cobyric acid decarboxylase-like protein